MNEYRKRKNSPTIKENMIQDIKKSYVECWVDNRIINQQGYHYSKCVYKNNLKRETWKEKDIFRKRLNDSIVEQITLHTAFEKKIVYSEYPSTYVLLNINLAPKEVLKNSILNNKKYIQTDEYTEITKLQVDSILNLWKIPK